MMNLCLQVGALEDAGRIGEAEALARASVKEQLGDALRSIAEDTPPPGGHALIIDGKALLYALGDDIKDSLLAVRSLPKSSHLGSYITPALLSLSLLSGIVRLSLSGMVLLHALYNDINDSRFAVIYPTVTSANRTIALSAGFHPRIQTLLQGKGDLVGNKTCPPYFVWLGDMDGELLSQIAALNVMVKTCESVAILRAG